MGRSVWRYCFLFTKMGQILKIKDLAYCQNVVTNRDDSAILFFHKHYVLSILGATFAIVDPPISKSVTHMLNLIKAIERL